MQQVYFITMHTQIGLAVGDTGEIQKKAHLTKLALQVCTHAHVPDAVSAADIFSEWHVLLCSFCSTGLQGQFQIYADRVYLVVTNRLMWF